MNNYFCLILLTVLACNPSQINSPKNFSGIYLPKNTEDKKEYVQLFGNRTFAHTVDSIKYFGHYEFYKNEEQNIWMIKFLKFRNIKGSNFYLGEMFDIITSFECPIWFGDSIICIEPYVSNASLDLCKESMK